MDLTRTAYDGQLAAITLRVQNQGDRVFLESLYECVANGGGIKLLDRDGVDLGTFQRPEAEDG